MLPLPPSNPCLNKTHNRPFDPSKANGSNGQWCWVGVPKSILINGRGNYYDCEDTYKRTVSVGGGHVAAAAVNMMISLHLSCPLPVVLG